jgi:AcrR family transcriptional regulator
MTPAPEKALSGGLTGTREHPSPNGDHPHDLSELQRQRILAAMARIACQDGLHSATVARILGHSRVARRRFYELFADREDCFLAVFDEAVALASERAGAACELEDPWRDRIRAGLLALLEFFDEEPELARACVVHALAAGPPVLARRREVLFDLTHVIDAGSHVRSAATPLSPLTAEGVVGAVLSVIHARLLQPAQERLTDLVNPLMAIIVLPYLGAAAAHRELSRSAPRPRRLTARRPRKASDPLEGLDMRMTYRTVRVLTAIACAPGTSNREVADTAGIKDQGQISKLLHRLEGRGLLRKGGPGQPEGGSNAWTLTPRGLRLARALTAANGRPPLGGS